MYLLSRLLPKLYSNHSQSLAAATPCWPGNRRSARQAKTTYPFHDHGPGTHPPQHSRGLGTSPKPQLHPVDPAVTPGFLFHCTSSFLQKQNPLTEQWHQLSTQLPWLQWLQWLLQLQLQHRNNKLHRVNHSARSEKIDHRSWRDWWLMSSVVMSDMSLRISGEMCLGSSNRSLRSPSSILRLSMGKQS